MGLFHATHVRGLNDYELREAMLCFAKAADALACDGTESREWWARREYARCRDERARRRERREWERRQ